MIDPQAEFETKLKSRGYSLTTTRRLVFSALQGEEPQSMRSVIAACPAIDRASVYRTIALFEQLGIVKRLQIGWKYKLELSDAFHYHHHHLTCLSCGQIIPFDEDDQLQILLEKIAGSQHFVMQEHQLEIQGLCQACIKT